MFVFRKDFVVELCFINSPDQQRKEERSKTLVCHWSYKAVQHASPFLPYCVNLEQFMRPLEPVCRIDKAVQYDPLLM